MWWTKITQLQEETNGLLRELIQAVKGQPAVTPKPLAPKPTVRQYTEKDVFRAHTRDDLIREQASNLENARAPWRTTPPSNAPSSSNSSPDTAATSPPSAER